MKCQSKEDFEKVNHFGQGAPNDAYAQYFIGNSFLNPLTDFKNGEFPLFNVTFEPGCHNNWHIHHAEKGKDPKELKEGTVIVIPANVKHWHGAKKDSWFSHISLEVPGENTSNEWLEPVADELYNAL